MSMYRYARWPVGFILFMLGFGLPHAHAKPAPQAPVVAPTETIKAVVSTSTQVGPKQPAPSKVKADAFTIQFTEGIQYAFIKMGDVWLALRASVKQPNVYSAFAVAQRCAKRQGGKGLITDEGIFVSMKAPGTPTVNPQTKRVSLPWKIGVTYDDTGHFSDGVAHLTISESGSLTCLHADNR